ncbi:hypothetical protein IQ06DRAFT_288762 [Phaeosphaeriaceae sp. SRC1lsM3a]|nr:hypothetical protein IQ06DRAFT_288762 [Stagonospora sp. SRC1lsM3a]
MSFREVRRTYYFDTDEFIDIVHDLEGVPEIPSSSDDATFYENAQAKLERWQKIFSIGAPEARYLLYQVRELDLLPSEQARSMWP